MSGRVRPAPLVLRGQRLVKCRALLVAADARGGLHRRAVTLFAPADLAVRAALAEVLAPVEYAALVVDAAAAFAKSEAGKVYQDRQGVYRWITVHPHGEDEPGVPVKIRESKTEPGTWHVVAGAGGKLNYLRLTGVKSPQEYREQALARRKKKKEQLELRREADATRRAGMSEEELAAEKEANRRKAEALEAKRVERHTREQAAIAKVAEKLGWPEEEWKFDATRKRLLGSGASAERIEKLEAQHHKRMFQRAKDALGATKRYLLSDREQAKKVLAGAPITTDDPETIVLNDILEPEAPGTGKGFKPVTREKSDRAIREDAARVNLESARAELAVAEATLSEATEEGDPAAVARVKDLRNQVRMAELVQQAETMTPEAIAAEQTSVADALREVRTRMLEYLPRLQQLRQERRETEGRATPEQAILEQRAFEDQRRIEVLRERAVDLEVLSGESVRPALEGEKATIRQQKQMQREAEIAREYGPEAVAGYRARMEMMDAARERYLAEMRHYRETGALKKPEQLTPKPVLDPQDALELLAAFKGIEALSRQIEKAEKASDFDERMFGKGYFTDVGRPSPEMLERAQKEIEAGIEESLTKAFLEAAESPELLAGRGGTFTEDMDRHALHRALERHVSAGAFNVLNNAALAALHTPTLTREVVDVLGAAGAAQLLAHVIRQHEDPAVVRKFAETLGEYHVRENVLEAEERIREFEEQLDRADGALAQVTDPSDVAVALQANRQRAEALEQARQIMGQALGEYEATAALTQALAERPRDTIQTNLGPIAVDQAIRQMRAIGLDRGDYEITSDGTNHFATIKVTGFEKLAKPVDPERAKLVDDILAIKRGERDEVGWTPKGTTLRPRTTFREAGIEPESLTAGLKPYTAIGASGDVDADVEEHIGRRAANGEDPNSILTSMHAHILDVPEAHRKAYAAAIDRVFPLLAPVKGTHADGTPRMAPVKAEVHAANVDQVVERWLARTGLDRTAAIHGQAVDLDHPDTHEAIVRALAKDPRAMVAFKAAGDLTDQDQRALRHYFAAEVAHVDPKTGVNQADVKAKLEALGPEPVKTSRSLFGGEEATPDWLEWKRQRDAIMHGAHFAGDAPRTSAWEEYVHALGGTTAAYRALQDRVKSGFLREFHTHYTNLTGKPLRLGLRSIAHAELHGTYVDPDARAKHLAQRQALIAEVKERQRGARGHYGAGSIAERMEREAQAEEIARQNQMGLLAGDGPAAKREPGKTERYTIGQRAEAQLASYLPAVARAFRPDAPVSLIPDGVYDGTFAYQQRIIKAHERAKRLAVAAGTGTGKTKIAIGAAAHLRGTGKIKRALFLAPSSSAGQWAGEFVNWADSKAQTWTVNPGTDRTQRMAEHADPDTHMVVHTHERFRDDMVHALAEHWGTTPSAAVDRFMTLDRKGAAGVLQDVWKKRGIDYGMLTVDEGHKLLDRDGKPDSVFSRIVQAASDITPYYMSATADPVKNDASELRSLLSKLDPSGRYDDKGEWTRRYGVNTVASAEALKREVAPWVYAYQSQSPNKVVRRRETVPLTPTQQAKYAAVLEASEKLRLARMKGEVDVAAAKVLAPARFEGLDEQAAQDLARKIQANPNPDQALARIVDGAPEAENAKIAKLLELVQERDVKTSPLLVFAHRLDAVDEIHRALERAGVRVGKIKGDVPTPDRDKVRRAFMGEGGTAPAYDALVLSDAAEAGLNLQRGQRLVQYDRAQTAKTHAQRNGRIDRLGQQHPEIELIDLVTDTPFEARAQQRLDTKYALRDVLTDPATTIDDQGLAGAMVEARRRALEEARTAKVAA